MNPRTLLIDPGRNASRDASDLPMLSRRVRVFGVDDLCWLLSLRVHLSLS